MDLFYYIFLSIVYLLTMHLALSTTREFHFFQAISLFSLGGFIGSSLDSYITGFVFAVVMHLMFWNKGAD
ncbi:hypothetical protein IPM65_03315 [Candidatus Roizmanbacteria bacterium]|nr:MAG: hypothetical protein IPM65_03315 [Candidatus Roizmanbacteria bacterium]